jgi:hypothetical protein
VKGHLLELLPYEAIGLANAARILEERAIGPIAAVSLRASPGVCRFVLHMQSGEDVELGEVEIGRLAAGGLAASIREHNAERSAK